MDVVTFFVCLFLGALIEFLVGNHYPGLGAVTAIAFVGGRVVRLLDRHLGKRDEDSLSEEQTEA